MHGGNTATRRPLLACQAMGQEASQREHSATDVVCQLDSSMENGGRESDDSGAIQAADADWRMPPEETSTTRKTRASRPRSARCHLIPGGMATWRMDALISGKWQSWLAGAPPSGGSGQSHTGNLNASRAAARRVSQACSRRTDGTGRCRKSLTPCVWVMAKTARKP